jgi:hypothetical protein
MSQQELVGAVAAAANVEPHLAQEALAEEKNDANDTYTYNIIIIIIRYMCN